VAQLTFEFRLDIVGDGPGLPAWQILAENLGIASRVCWNGSMARDLIPRWLGSLHLLVLPSRTGTTWKEQFGRVLAEAMASGVPVVGSDSGEIPYVIGDAGLVFPEGNAAGLASSIDSIYRMPGLRERLVARGRERCSGVFSVEAQLPNYLGLFRSLTNARKSPGIP
jgi:glycosyltransferase involved in cell wall biosynthesis